MYVPPGTVSWMPTVVRTSRLKFPGLIQLTDRDARAAGKVAASAVADAHPEYDVHNASLRAAEDTRFVFAVFYSIPNQTMRPGPYTLVAVSRDSTTTEIIHPTPDSPYWIRGRK